MRRKHVPQFPNNNQYGFSCGRGRKNATFVIKNLFVQPDVEHQKDIFITFY